MVDYDLHPPAGGDAQPGLAAPCGFYDEPIPDEYVVHTLEHGAVWLAYAPDLPAADIEVIHELVARQRRQVLATPVPGPRPGVAVVATAWARQLALDSVDDPRLAEFVDQYQDGRQAPEASVRCPRAGLGEPIP